MNSFDWYISPSDKFQFEEKFERRIENQNQKNLVKLLDLNDIFIESRLESENDFLLIWYFDYFLMIF